MARRTPWASQARPAAQQGDGGRSVLRGAAGGSPGASENATALTRLLARSYSKAPMKCDRCENEATVHEVTVHKGKKVEKHLCEQCAKTDGIAVQSHAPINALLTKFVMSSAGAASAPTQKLVCPGCAMTFADFRQHGLLGCPECYAAFEEQLGPLIERAHEGGVHHVGKTPTRSGGSVDRQRVLATLRRQLSEAVAAEHYERAAELRDELRSIGAHEEADADRPTKNKA